MRPGPRLLVALALAGEGCTVQVRLTAGPAAAPAPLPEPMAVPPEPPAPAVAAKPPRITDAARRLAAAVSTAFSNVDPRPVTREFAQQPWVQFRSDRGARELEWREAPVRVLHGPTERATVLEPCAVPVGIGLLETRKGGAYFVEPHLDGDKMFVKGKSLSVRLPRGALHGGCLTADEQRLWIGWSTPEQPADLYTVALRDGVVRKLRNEARPGLGGLADVRIEARQVGISAAPIVLLWPLRGAIPARRAVVLAEPVGTSIVAYSAPARAFVETGAVVLHAADDPASLPEVLQLAQSLGTRVALVIAGTSGAERPAPEGVSVLRLDPHDRVASLAAALSEIAEDEGGEQEGRAGAAVPAPAPGP